MEKALKTQLEIKQNAEELQNYLKDLKTWKNEMKIVESKLTSAGPEQQSIPPPRNVGKKRGSSLKEEKSEEKKRISGFDYKSWDKFDAEEACEEIEAEDSSTTPVEEIKEVEKTIGGQKEKTIEKMKNIDEAFFEKEMGNKLVKEEKWKEAKECYRRAIDLDPDNAIYHANRALCHLKLSQFKAAEVDSTVATQLDPTYVKAYLRRGFARKALQQFQEAKADFEKVLELEPTNAQAKAEVSKIEQTLANIAKPASNITFNPKNMFTSKPTGTGKDRKPISKKVAQNEIEVVSVRGPEESVLTKEPATSSAISKSVVGTKKGVIDQTNRSHLEDGTFLFTNEIPTGWKEVTPVLKPSHLRSKDPLQKILIQDVVKSDMPSLPLKKKPIESESLNKPPLETANPEKPVLETKLSGVQSKCSSLEYPRRLEMPCTTSVPTVPQTCVQFQKSWKIVQPDSDMSYKFLKQITLDRLPFLFGSSLESSLLSEMLAALTCPPFLADPQFIYDFLHHLTAVERFSSLVLFMTDTDQKAVRQCLQELEASEKFTSDELGSLREKFDLT